MPEDGVMLGWHCAKCWESEYVALGARHGFFVFCNLRSPNYSAHAGVRTPGFKFTQKHKTAAQVKVEDKVHVTFIHSDGDAIWAKNNFYARNWLDSQRGKFPCTWELQPYAVDFAPGQLEYYYRTRTGSDYFVAGPSGAGYTCPIINRHQDRFLANSRTYFKKTSIRSVLLMNRDPYAAFEELDNGDFPERITKAIPEALGFVHGYGGNPFGESAFVGDVPCVQTAQYVGDMHDIYEEVAKFADLVPRRPIFVEVHVRESADLSLASPGMTERFKKHAEGWWPVNEGGAGRRPRLGSHRPDAAPPSLGAAGARRAREHDRAPGRGRGEAAPECGRPVGRGD